MTRAHKQRIRNLNTTPSHPSPSPGTDLALSLDEVPHRHPTPVNTCHSHRRMKSLEDEGRPSQNCSSLFSSTTNKLLSETKLPAVTHKWMKVVNPSDVARIPLSCSMLIFWMHGCPTKPRHKGYRKLLPVFIAYYHRTCRVCKFSFLQLNN